MLKIALSFFKTSFSLILVTIVNGRHLGDVLQLSGEGPGFVKPKIMSHLPLTCSRALIKMK